MNGSNRGLIGFDATALETRRSGVGQYTARLLEALVARGDGRRFALLAGRNLNGHTPAGTLGQPGPRFPNRSLWMQFVLPRHLLQLQPDLCHFTNSLAPLHAPCPLVVTLHDMSLFLFPGTHPAKSLLLVRTLIPAVARRAAAIVTVSHSARRDIIAGLRIPPDKVHVVYEAPGPNHRVISDRAELQRVRRKYGLDEPFVLYVGTLEPRKNLVCLVRAFARLRARGFRERLLLVGQLGWKYHALLREVERLNLGDAVRLPGYVPDEDLPALYNLARVFAFPSLYEGFGLPVVEAMACGAPVLTSNCSSLAEIGAGAALLIDPRSEEAVADGLARLLTGPALRNDLRTAGLARAGQFSWARAADETVCVYETIGAAKSVRPPGRPT